MSVLKTIILMGHMADKNGSSHYYNKIKWIKATRSNIYLESIIIRYYSFNLVFLNTLFNLLFSLLNTECIKY